MAPKGCATESVPKPVAAAVAKCMKPPSCCPTKGAAASSTKGLLKKVAESGGSGLIPSGYGFVAMTAIGSVVLVTWKAMKVSQARDEFKVPYPQMYSTDNMAFNCVQRAHQNTLENYPQFLLMLMIGGLEMPYFCAIGGWIWILGRICYAKGYYTGDPHKRARGTFGMLGMVMLFAATTKFALKHLW